MTTSDKLAIAVLLLVGVGACRLQEASGQIGKDCQEARECDDDTLGCVPVNLDNPAAGSACMPPPEEWLCEGKLYGDAACDCGCAVADIDCPNALVASCAANGNQCPDGENPDPVDNTQCI